MFLGDYTQSTEVPRYAVPGAYLYQKNRDEIASIFSLFGHNVEDASLQEIYDIAHPWTLGDHWNLQSKVQLHGIDHGKLMDNFARMGLVDAVMPSGGNYDHLIILGGTMLGNMRRAKFTKKLLDTRNVQISDRGDMWFLAGQRTRLDRETPDLIEIQSTLQGLQKEDDWLKLQSGLPESAGNWGRSFATETELAKLTLMATFGSLYQTYANLQLGMQKNIEGVPFRGVTHRSFEAMNAGKKLGINILNAVAVDRPQGSPRHTTSSSAREWLEFAAPKVSARILVVNNNPHISRGQADITKIFEMAGRDDLEVESAGPAALTVAPAQVFLGEIARMIYNAKPV